MRIAILMPSFDEGPDLVRTLAGIRERSEDLGGVVVYLVDDGSSSPIALEGLPPAGPAFDVVLARHRINLGQGAALETARQLALADPRHDTFVTMDSDGQHRIEDLRALIDAVSEGADVAFGNRFAASSNVPFVRRLVLRAARIFEYAITGLWLADAHNGFRAFSRKGAQVVKIRQNRMAHATEIKQRVALARDRLAIVEVPVSIRYSVHSMAKGQSSLGAVHILRDIAFRFLFGPE